MTRDNDSILRLVWCGLVDHPRRVDGIEPQHCRTLLQWNDADGDYGPADMSDETARYALLRQVLGGDGDALVAAFDACQNDIASRYGAPESDTGEYEALLCIADDSREYECEGMLGDWEARLGVPSGLVDALRDEVAAYRERNFDGGRV